MGLIVPVWNPELEQKRAADRLRLRITHYALRITCYVKSARDATTTAHYAYPGLETNP